MDTYDKLPLYELKISPENGSLVDAIALVEQPAIESDFIAFSQQSHLEFIGNDERQELIGAAMIPDMKIFRRDKDGTEYNVFFSSDTIRNIAQTYFKQGFQNNLNLDHTATPAKSFIYQSYIVDESKGMPSPKGLNLVDGSWVVGVKVTDNDVWNDIKSGKRKGFSVEGIFNFLSQKNTNYSKDDMLDVELMDTIKTLIAHLKNNNKKN